MTESFKGCLGKDCSEILSKSLKSDKCESCKSNKKILFIIPANINEPVFSQKVKLKNMGKVINHYFQNKQSWSVALKSKDPSILLYTLSDAQSSKILHRNQHLDLIDIRAYGCAVVTRCNPKTGHFIGLNDETFCSWKNILSLS